MQFFSLTDRGKVRENNEDSCKAKQLGNYTVLVVADGMGGASGGEIASAKAVDSIFAFLTEEYLGRLALAEIPRMLKQLIKKINTDIYSLAQRGGDFLGMGTTLELCILRENTLYIAHIGDSRVYKLSTKGDFTRLTKDHSLVEYMLDAGTITPEEALNHPQKNIITKALGTAPEIEADILCRRLESGEKLLLCSDGLTNMLSEECIAEVLLENTPLSSRAEKLISLANDKGGHDNISAVILDC